MENYEESESRRLYLANQSNPHLKTAYDLVEAVAAKHPIPSSDRYLTRFKMLMHLQRLAFHMGIPTRQFQQLNGKTVLDVACGREDRDITMRPWVCDMLHELGCEVTGVDHPDAVIQAPWPFIGLDLREPGALYTFDNSSFDIVHCTHFIGNQNPRFDDPEFIMSLTADAYKRVKDSIIFHIKRIYKKPGGIAIVGDESYSYGS